jgi:hypothetical protein
MSKPVPGWRLSAAHGAARGAVLGATRVTAPAWLAAAIALWGASPARADGDVMIPAGPSFKVNTAVEYSQRQAQVDCDPDGDEWVVTWHSPLGADIFMRVFTGDGVPLTIEKKVDSAFTFMNQSEPEVCMDDFGNFMIAWSDYNGSDGSGMGIFGRPYDKNGNPKSLDFQVNESSQDSQWEPKGDALPGGGFVMAFSGQPDGDTFFRLFDAQGHPTTGDIEVNVNQDNAQIDSGVAASRMGSMLFAYVDFSGAGGAGQNIYTRAFDLAGNPLQPIEQELNTSTIPGDQREPRVAADGLGHFIVVYEDGFSDGSGSAIYARRYDAAGLPLGPEFRVNQVTTGDQLRPDVAADWVGNFVVSWEDYSTGRSVATIRRFDNEGVPLTGDVSVDASLAGDQFFPSVTMDRAGQDITVTFAADGGPGIFSGGDDIFARRFHTTPITQVGAATPGGTFQLALDLPSGGGLPYVLLMSSGTSPGLLLPDTRTLHLKYDALLAFSLGFPNAAGLSHFVGALDAGGAATASLTLPGSTALLGLTLNFAAVTLDLAQVGLGSQLRHVTDPLAVTIQ